MRVSTPNAGSSCNIHTAWNAKQIDWTEMPGVEYQNVGEFHEGIWLNKPAVSAESARKMRVSNHNTSAFWGGYTRIKGTILTDKESDIFEITRRTKQCDLLSSLLFNTVLQIALKDDLTRWQKTQGMGICLGDSESNCLTRLRFADDVLLFSTSQVQLLKCCATSSRVPRG